MKNLGLYITLVIFSFVAACDVQSGITKKSVEKYAPSPTPEWKVVVEEPIDPADIITVDTSVQEPMISINKAEEAKKIVKCDKYNRVMVNGDGREVEIKGVCSQLMINGNRSKVTAVALSEIIVNGRENSVQYSKYANGKKPLIKDNGNENTILKAAPPLKP
jgi:Protein of unknown function (DUF3060)